MMFEISLGVILAVITLFLFPSLMVATLYVVGFSILALIGGGVVFYMATAVGVTAQNAFWLATMAGLLSGLGGIPRLARLVAHH